MLGSKQNRQFGVQSMKMLKVRAALEEKLRQKNMLSTALPKPEKNKKHLKPVNGYYFITIKLFREKWEMVIIIHEYLLLIGCLKLVMTLMTTLLELTRPV